METYSEIDKVNVAMVEKRIGELEKKIKDRRSQIMTTYNGKLSVETKKFLADPRRTRKPDETYITYLKKVLGLYREFHEKC